MLYDAFRISEKLLMCELLRVYFGLKLSATNSEVTSFLLYILSVFQFFSEKEFNGKGESSSRMDWESCQQGRLKA